jgi:hypothetical protein
MLIVIDVWIVYWWCEETCSLFTDTMCVKYKKKLMLFWAWKARLLQLASIKETSWQEIATDENG